MQIQLLKTNPNFKQIQLNQTEKTNLQKLLIKSQYCNENELYTINQNILDSLKKHLNIVLRRI